MTISTDQNTITFDDGRTFQFIESIPGDCRCCYFREDTWRMCISVPCSSRTRTDGKNGYFVPQRTTQET